MNQFKNTSTHSRILSGGSPVAFFTLVILLSIPFWVLGGVTGILLLPGLPIDALMVVCPGAAALILAYRENGKSGMITHMKRALDYNRIRSKYWYAVIILLMPVASILSFACIRLSGTLVPAPKIAVLPTLILCILFFTGALCEELGWSGYAIDPMQNRLGTIQASIILGLFWSVYHYIALIQAHRSLTWIIWWSFGTVALRVISVWIFNNTGKSVFAVSLFHMTINLTWQLFPVNGSYYDPRITGLILGMAAAIIILAGRSSKLIRKG